MQFNIVTVALFKSLLKHFCSEDVHVLISLTKIIQNRRMVMERNGQKYM